MVLGVLTFVLARRLDLFARLVAAARRRQGTGDEALVVTVLVLAFALAAYAWRRWWEARRAFVASARAEEILRASEARFGLLMRQLPAYLWTTDSGLRLTSFLGGGFRRDGNDPRDHVGQTVAEFFGVDDPTFPPLAAHRCALDGAPSEYPLQRGGRHYEVHVEPLRDAAGAIVGCLGLGVDVTERERAAALQDSEARFRAIFEGAAIGICLTDPADRIIQSNRALLAFLDYCPPELNRQSFTRLIHPDDAASDRSLYNELMAGTLDRYQLEQRYFRKDRSVVWGRLTVSLASDATGVPQYAIRMVEDLTASKSAETELRHLRAKLTPMEWRVLPLLARTDLATYRQIGAQLYSNGETVRDHMQAIARKLGVAGRRELVVATAREHGLL